MPATAWITANGGRAAPGTYAIVGAVPYVHCTPTRGLKLMRFGATSLRMPSVSRSSGLNDGRNRNRLPSARTPYCTCTVLDGRHASPTDAAAVSWSLGK